MMALLGTLHHPKTAHLAALLRIERCYALGLLEAMWHVTAAHTPAGDLGSLSNARIAEEMAYSLAADPLIAALLKARWLDADRRWRLLVHDWHIHAGEEVRRGLMLAKRAFRTASGPVACPAFVPEAGMLVRAAKA